MQEGFKLPEDGLFSGFDPSTGPTTIEWNYESGAGHWPLRCAGVRPRAGKPEGGGIRQEDLRREARGRAPA